MPSPEKLSELVTEPTERLVFNAPFDVPQQCRLRLTNNGDSSVGWAVKTNNWQQLDVEPPCGIIGPEGSVTVVVRLSPFDNSDSPSKKKNDRISFEWTNVGDEVKTFNKKLFQGDVIIGRKNIAIQYNANVPFVNGTSSLTTLVHNARQVLTALATSYAATMDLAGQVVVLSTARSRVLRQYCAPQHLQVINDSPSHIRGSETHFRLVIVSDQFEGKSLVERHRLVNSAVQSEFSRTLHALSIFTRTPAEWRKENSHDAVKCQKKS